jgi:hypothetical protein
MTTLTSDHPVDHARPSIPGRARYSFRHWRRGRPFWGSLFAVLGGIEIISIPYSPIGVVVHEGIAGVSGMFIGALMIMFGVSSMFAPTYRIFAGIATVLLSLVALPATNFGGFLLGTLCGLFGGSFVVAWAPRPGMTADTRRQRRAARRLAAAEGTAASEDPATGTATPLALVAEPGEAGDPDGSIFAADAFAGAEAAHFAQEQQTRPAASAGPLSAGFTDEEIAAAETAAFATVPAESTEIPVNPED